jgi:hypothetical protein
MDGLSLRQFQQPATWNPIISGFWDAVNDGFCFHAMTRFPLAVAYQLDGEIGNLYIVRKQNQLPLL